jgi:hypothetical protein
MSKLTPEKIRELQKADAEREHQRVKSNLTNLPAAVPAKTGNGSLTVIDNKNSVAAYLDEVAPSSSIVGRGIKFDPKAGTFLTTDDGSVVKDDVDFAVLADQTLGGKLRFNGKGNPPTRHMGLIYSGYRPPSRESLGDLDQSQWEIGLDGKPADPWQDHLYLVLQQSDSAELFTFIASTKTSRMAAANLLRHYDRMPADMYPLVRLKTGGFAHKDTRVGFVKTPVLAIVGKVQKDTVAKPEDASAEADMGDAIPF